MTFTIDARGAASLFLRTWFGDEVTQEKRDKLASLLDLFYEEGVKAERKRASEESVGGGTTTGNAIQTGG